MSAGLLVFLRKLEEYLYGRASSHLHTCSRSPVGGISAGPASDLGHLRGICSPLIPASVLQALWTQNNAAVVYPCHAVIVTLQIQTGEQRFFIGHTDKVSVTLFTQPYSNAVPVPEV